MSVAVAATTRYEGYYTPHVVSAPAGIQAGDLLIIALSSPHSSVTMPSGWTEIYLRQPQSPPYEYIRAAAYYRVAQAGDGNVTITTGDNTNLGVLYHRITGADAADPIHRGASAMGSTSGSSIGAPVLQPSIGGTLALSWGHSYYRRVESFTGTYTVGSYPGYGDMGGDGYIAWAYGAGPAAGGETSEQTWGLAGSVVARAAGHVLIAPAAAARRGRVVEIL